MMLSYTGRVWYRERMASLAPRRSPDRTGAGGGWQMACDTVNFLHFTPRAVLA
ncbi:hypothetical protein GCM10009106_14970 [Sphingomonas japonica]